MTILSDNSIAQLVKNKEITIDPFVDKNLTPNGYDLTVEEIEIPEKQKTTRKKMTIPPLSLIHI